MPTTLAETVAWTTGADWPIDGEAATIESIAVQVQELKDRTNYLKSDSAQGTTALKAKTDQLGYQIVARGMLNTSGILSQTVTATGTTPASLGSAWTPTSLQLNDIIDISFGPLDIVNGNTTGNHAYLIIQTSQNGGAFGAVSSYKVPTNRTMTFSVLYQFTCTIAGAFGVALALLNDNTNGVTVTSLEQNSHIGCYTVMRPIV